MIKEFKIWMIEIQQEALAEKRRKASKKGDEDKWKKEIWRSPEKNKAIKHRFRDEGAKLGYKCRPSYITGAGEWLYDLVWRKFDKNNELLEVVLTMEIEVSDMDVKAIKYDFNKLLQSDSQYKILVFQLKSDSEVNSALKQFEDLANKYHSKSTSSFLLCGWVTSKNEFLFNEFTVG